MWSHSAYVVVRDWYDPAQPQVELPQCLCDGELRGEVGVVDLPSCRSGLAAM